MNVGVAVIVKQLFNENLLSLTSPMLTKLTDSPEQNMRISKCGIIYHTGSNNKEKKMVGSYTHTDQEAP
jgi:hypothetical protein